VTFGFIVFGSTTIFVPVDGQHRTAAIVGYEANGRHVDGVLDEMEGFSQDGASVQLTLEDNIIQLHQDFADAAKTKPISANTQAAYDMRQPLN
jgi:DNA sulfur modification protein DndB